MRYLVCKAALALFLALLLAVGMAAFTGCGNKADTTDTAGDEEEAANPEDTVARFFRAVERQDASAVAGLFDAESLDRIKESLGSGYKDSIAEFFFADMPEGVKFKSLKYDTEVDGKEATVEVVKGKLAYIDEYGDEISEDLVDTGEPLVFRLIKVKGKWYVSVETFPDLLAEYDETGTPSGDLAACPDCGGEGGWYQGDEALCSYCNGTGVQDVQDVCYNCGGAGDVEGGDGRYTCDVCGGSGLTWDWVACEYCGGTGLAGEAVWIPCGTCDGTGWVPR